MKQNYNYKFKSRSKSTNPNYKYLTNTKLPEGLLKFLGKFPSSRKVSVLFHDFAFTIIYQLNTYPLWRSAEYLTFSISPHLLELQHQQFAETVVASWQIVARRRSLVIAFWLSSFTSIKHNYSTTHNHSFPLKQSSFLYFL